MNRLRMLRGPLATMAARGLATARQTTIRSITALVSMVRGDIHTNTIESYFSIMKRGITGVYHHISAQHLKRYLAEFDFRYNERLALDVTDAERATKAVKGVVGKRMTYRRPDGRPNGISV